MLGSLTGRLYPEDRHSFLLYYNQKQKYKITRKIALVKELNASA
jgi:hypothetical protein